MFPSLSQVFPEGTASRNSRTSPSPFLPLFLLSFPPSLSFTHTQHTARVCVASPLTLSPRPCVPPQLQALQPALVFLMVFGACQLLPDSPSVATSKALVYVATFLLLFVMPYFDKPKVHTNVGRLSYMVGSAASPNETAPIRNVRTEELVKAPVLPGLPPNPTLRDLFRSAAAMNKDRPCLGTREVIEAFTDTSGSRPQVKMELGGYQWLTFAQVKDRVDNAGAALAQLGLTKGTNVALYADSSVEWAIASHACFAYGFPVITAYAALGLDALAHSLSEGDVRVLFADATLLPQVAKVMNGRTYEDEGQQVDAAVNGLTTVVYFNNRAVTPDFALQTHIAKLASRDAAHGGPITCISFDELISSGASADVDAEAFAPSADDLAVIMYTRCVLLDLPPLFFFLVLSLSSSLFVLFVVADANRLCVRVRRGSGSTGIPKGVMISHANLVGAIGGLSAGVAGLSANDVYLAYLPCSHVLELAAENCILTAGAALGYGSPLTLTESSRGIAPGRGVKGDAAELKPSVMAAVPAVMDLIRDSILKKVASAGGVKQLLFNFAMRMKTLAYQSGHDSPLWDLLVFDKLRTKVLGGRVRLMLSGGGPLSGATQLFMNVVFCCPVGQGYGEQSCGGAWRRVLWLCDLDCLSIDLPPPIIINALQVLRKRVAPAASCGRTTVPSAVSARRANPPTSSWWTGKKATTRAATKTRAAKSPCPAPTSRWATSRCVSVHGVVHGLKMLLAWCGDFIPSLLLLLVLLLSSPQRPEKTAEDFRKGPDGRVWFHTGDIGELCPDGTIKIVRACCSAAYGCCALSLTLLCVCVCVCVWCRLTARRTW